MLVGSLALDAEVLDPRHLEMGVGQELVRDETAEVAEFLFPRGGIGGGDGGDEKRRECEEERPLHAPA